MLLKDILLEIIKSNNNLLKYSIINDSSWVLDCLLNDSFIVSWLELNSISPNNKINKN